MSKSELGQLIGSPSKAKKVNVMPIDGRSHEQVILQPVFYLLGGNLTNRTKNSAREEALALED